ncbi:MAG: glycosyltransferase family 9 protein [Chlamydiales bacterium]|nr:glycosyltransferase family 9 protein [Chlamydiales bacterium]
MKKTVQSFKNFVLKLFVKILRYFIKQNAIQDRFLIISTTGLGDTLWGTPSIRSLREHYPKGYIAILTSPIGKELLENNPYINDLFLLKKPIITSLISLYSKLKKKKISYILSFHSSQRIVLPFAYLLGAKKIIGTEGANKGLDSLITHLLPKKPQHEIVRRLEMIAALTNKKTIHHQIEMTLSQQDKKNALPLMDHLQDHSRPCILLHPGSKDLFKRWPSSHFIALGNLLSMQHKCHIFITGNQSEKELVLQIASHIPNSTSLIDLPLKTFAALIQNMDAMVCNDTGPMHMAFAIKTPTIAIFCPTNPHLCGPYAVKDYTVIAKKKTCSPCLQKKCANPFCMLQIGTQEVYEAVLCQLCKSEKFASKALRKLP